MTLSTINVTSFQLVSAPGLDSIQIHIQDIEPGRGRLTVECFGDAWSAFWGAMGECTVREFLSRCDADYVASSMLELRKKTANERRYLTRILTAVLQALKDQP